MTYDFKVPNNRHQVIPSESMHVCKYIHTHIYICTYTYIYIYVNTIIVATSYAQEREQSSWVRAARCGPEMCCSVLQCDVVWCSVMQCDAVCRSVPQCDAVCCSVMQ